MQKINIMISAKTRWVKSVTKMRWYRKNWLKMPLNDLKCDLKYCVGRMLKLQRKHLLCTQQRQGIQAGHRILENHVKSRQRQYMKKHCERKESNVKKPVEDLTCKHKYEQAVSFTTQK